MSKVTAIIDIGSNSTRMVVFKKTSRYAFHLINESKSKVQISEGCYEHGGVLQEIPMQRAYDALESFINIAHNLKAKKILCVATSALRDAPNSNLFLNRISKELHLNIKVIDGEKEAYYGGVAALNLLDCDNFTTIDIGGGSTEFAFVNNKNITETVSLNIGTIRIKELFFNKGDLEGAKEYIYSELQNIQNKFETAVALGGTARALSRSIIKKDNYPLDILHGFTYDVQKNVSLFEKIIDADCTKELKKLSIRKDRYDTIATGTFIFKTILEYFGVKKVVTSGVGVREGVFLSDLLRTSKHQFPANFSVSIRSLIDRFVDDKKQSAYLGNNAKKIFDVLSPMHRLDRKYRSILVIASKLQLVGYSLNYYKNQENSFWYILHGMNYGFTHHDMTLIAIVSKFSKKSLPKEKDIEEFKQLLPDLETIQWLNFMMTLNITLNGEFSRENYNFRLDEDILYIESSTKHYLIKSDLEKIKIPAQLTFRLN
jgi:exopolyphosphatase / guanosine-5'-triphosphate,3'-diphosphate pyrophosphatase